MRRSFCLLTLVFWLPATAQDWALINPAYKYNYSNDGSDTISNQIEILQVDTIGMDSIFFHLGLRVSYCDTCLSWTGGVSACDGCYLWDNAPEFLGRSCLIDPGGWSFIGPDTMIIQSSYGLGSTWTFSPDGTTATVIMVDTATVLGGLDSVKCIVTSALDTMFIGKQHGIIRFRAAAQEAMVLIGVEGLGVGITRPSLEDFFPYAPGDVLEYGAYRGGIDGIGGPYGGGILFKMTIQGVDVLDSAVALAVQSICGSWSGGGCGPPACGVCGVDSFQLSFDEIPHWGILWSRPGELMAPPSMGCLSDAWAVPKHYRDGSGRYHITTSVKPIDNWSDDIPAFHYLEPTTIPHLFAFGPSDDGIYADTTYGLHYVSGIGFTSFKLVQFESWQGYVLNGALIAGDTIGSLTPDGVILGVVQSQDPLQIEVLPNPANDLVVVSGLPPGTTHIQLLEASGRLIEELPLTGPRAEVSLTDLAAGLYWLKAGAYSHRLIIAR